VSCLVQHEPERAAQREHDADDKRERVRSHCQNLTPPSPTNSRIPFPFRPAFTVLGSTLTVYTKFRRRERLLNTFMNPAGGRCAPRHRPCHFGGGGLTTGSLGRGFGLR
jgi:hypothetical protein